MSGRTFVAPSKGAWELETTHTVRPMTRFLQRAFARGIREGFAEGSARYGSLLETIEAEFVHDFTYMRMRPFGAPPDAKGPPPKIVFQLLTRLHPSLRKRIATSRDAFAKKLWRDDLELWDCETRPKAEKAHRAIQAVEPSGLSDDALVSHLTTVAKHAEDNARLHHRYTLTCALPVGDFIAHVASWT